MTVLVVVPDYISHWYPLSAVAAALRARGHKVVVATGRALAAQIAADGHEHAELALGSGSNSGATRAQRDEELEAFFAATREGMIATLRYQAERRRHDLLWEPHAVARRLQTIVADVAPDAVLVDQLAFGATAALRGLRARAAIRPEWRLRATLDPGARCCAGRRRSRAVEARPAQYKRISAAVRRPRGRGRSLPREQVGGNSGSHLRSSLSCGSRRKTASKLKMEIEKLVDHARNWAEWQTIELER